MKMVGESVVVVEGDMDLKALKSACRRHTTAYTPPLRVVDTAKHNPEFSKRCKTREAGGNLPHPLPRNLDSELKLAFPVGKAAAIQSLTPP
jgi:hypothetical protein